ncbi:hypothetical protein AYI69_g1189 [Smittium culicis]|uniref:Uncharacterized protein n=1 Tax=Smittium culicis TaxID=133412 RepID=A0A1R1YQZ6_9FUNG|nr:hypothetical protein AYI69_g1189 [Smittium culicis]
MDQEGINQVPVSQDQVKELTEMVRELLRERERNIEPEEPYVTTRIPLTYLAVYPELFEALPSIEEDFFRTPLTEKRKEAIHSYQKNADTTLHGIQVALAQATRMIDFYVHHWIQDNPGITTDDQHIVFSNTMRVLLADVASMITQGRLDNLHKGMEFPGVTDSIKKTGIEQQGLRGEPTKLLESFDEESAASPKSDTVGAATADAPSDTHQEENHFRGPPDSDGRSSHAPVQEGYRGGHQSRSKDTFMHILTHKTCKKYLRFWWNGKSYQLRVLPFGLSLSPRTFAKVLPPVLTWSRSKGMQINTRNMTLKVPSSKVRDPSPEGLRRKACAGRPAPEGLTCNPESEILEGASNQMEWAVIHPKNTRAGDLYRIQRQFMVGVSWVKTIFRDMESAGGTDAHQFQGATDDLIFSTSQEAQKEWSISDQKSTTLNAMLGPHDVWLPDTEQQGSTRCRSTGVGGRAYTLGHVGTKSRSGSEGQTGTTDSNTDCSSIKISNMVPRPDEIINIPTASATGDNNNSRPQNRKIAVNREQKLEFDGLADQRSFLQEQGLSDLSIDLSFQTNDVLNVNLSATMSNNAFYIREPAIKSPPRYKHRK